MSISRRNAYSGRMWFVLSLIPAVVLALLLASTGQAAWIVLVGVVLCVAGAMIGAGVSRLTTSRMRTTQTLQTPPVKTTESSGSQSLSSDSLRLRAIFDASHVASLATDASGVITLANPASSALLRRPIDRLLGRTLEEVITHAELLDCHNEALQGRAGGCEIRMIGGLSSLALEAWCQPVAGGGAVVTLRDVTEHSRTLQLRTEFVANASHELRTPLASLRLASETLEGGAWRDEAMRMRLFSVIASNVNRLEDLTRDLLDLSRIEQADAPGTLQDVDLEALLGSLRDRFDPLMRERRVAVESRLHERSRVIRSDPRLLEPILTNLVDNALKFAHEGTSVIVSSEPLADGSACLRVIDRGIGIPLEQQSRIFERFYQVDVSRDEHSPRRGTGLGLAIVRHAVRALGGSVRVESVWQQGTTMIVELPGACVQAERRD